MTLSVPYKYKFYNFEDIVHVTEDVSCVLHESSSSFFYSKLKMVIFYYSYIIIIIMRLVSL